MKGQLPYRLFGIRHHGPGSARRLLRALAQWEPDCLLVEAPADAQSELEQAGQLALEPPVALVLYDAKDIQRAFYYPFARFSPEWQAMQWAGHHQVPVIAMDLPVSNQLPLREQVDLRLDASLPKPQLLLHDPLGEIAQIAGFSDKEQWWDTTFEKEADDLQLFAAVEELITALRREYENQERPETLLREAYMRKVLRKTIKGNYQRIAVVCGAWHVPALREIGRFKVAADNQRLKGLPKTKVQAAWIPWSYPRLAKEGGYGAGVTSPAWYEQLYEHGQAASAHWMVLVSRLLREEGLDSSPAHAQEATRLAQTLAAMHGQRIPSLDDMREAALSVLCYGQEERLELVESQLVLGRKVGRVPKNASTVPLQKDLLKQLKSSRLNKYWEKVGELWLKATKANPRGGIDLREPADLLKSQLLHQLQLLNIDWGERQGGTGLETGAFKEFWILTWQPEFSLRIIEAAMWGNSIREAASTCLQDHTESSLGEMAQRILLGLRAGLNDATTPLVSNLRERAAVSRDVRELLLALPPLVNIIQYGDARKTDVTALALLVEELVPRLASGILGLCVGIDEEMAGELRQDILSVHQSLTLLQLPLLDDHWWPALHKLADHLSVHALIQGMAIRLLFNQERLQLRGVEERMGYALSTGNEALAIAHWLSGFLSGSGLLLLHHRALWQLVNRWVDELHEEEMELVLPLLRRTFANFSPGERQRMLQLVQQKRELSKGQEKEQRPIDLSVFEDTRKEQVLSGLSAWINEEEEKEKEDKN